MLDNALHFDVYQYAEPLEAEWLESLLRHLWEKVLRFAEEPEPYAIRWEDELQRNVGGYSTYSEAPSSMAEFHGPLGTLIHHIHHSGGVFQFYDRGLLLYLRFDDTFAPGNSIALNDPMRLRLINISTLTSGQQAWSYRYTPSIFPRRTTADDDSVATRDSRCSTDGNHGRFGRISPLHALGNSCVNYKFYGCVPFCCWMACP